MSWANLFRRLARSSFSGTVELFFRAKIAQPPRKIGPSAYMRNTVVLCLLTARVSVEIIVKLVLVMLARNDN